MIIKYQKYKFIISPLDTLELPPYKGSTFRGGFGNAFKRVVCVFKYKQCQDCLVNRECAYSYIFETPLPQNITFFPDEKYETVPHPFILEPPLTDQTFFEKGTKLSFSLILIGKAVKYLPFFVMAFEYLGELGIGKARSRYELLEIAVDNQIIYKVNRRQLTTGKIKTCEIPEKFNINSDLEENVTIKFITPIRLKHQRKLVSRVEFYILITNLLRRLALLNFYHGEGIKPQWNHREIIERAKEVVLNKDKARWMDWERYSHRQKVRMKLGGLLGEVEYVGKIAAFKPLLYAGEIFHVGKGTSFGLGKYCLSGGGQ